MNRNLNISLLRTFVAVAELGQISRAAQRVNVTQSAASQQISRLEEQLGVRLLERRSNRVRLSVEGERLYTSARQLLAMNDTIVADIVRTRDVVEIRFGVPHDIVERVSPPIIKRFAATNAHVSIRLLSLSTEDLLSYLANGEIDLCLATEPAGTSLGVPVMLDRLVWAGARNGRVHETDPLPVALGDDRDRFSRTASEALDRSGIRWRRINQPGGLGSVFAMLAADMVVAPFLSRLLQESLCEIDDPRLPELPQYQVNLVLAPEESRPHVLEFALHVSAFFRDMAETPLAASGRSVVSAPSSMSPRHVML